MGIFDALNKKEDVDLRPGKEDYNQKHLWCPFAKIQDTKMKTKGKYRLHYPEGAVVHFTASGPDASQVLAWGREMGYCYFVIGKDGTIYQSFPLDEWGFHAGPSRWMQYEGVSPHFVGIEVVCAGNLTEVKSDKIGEGTKYAAWFDYAQGTHQLKSGANLRTLDQVRISDRTNNIKPGTYEKFTLLQEESLVHLLIWLKYNNPDVFSFSNVAGHDEVSPDRKCDPGGALSITMPRLRQLLQNNYTGGV